jgi:hypothetical protein
MPTIVAALLAHQGGWDEALLVLGPIVVIVAALAVVKRRVDRMAREEPARDAAPEPGQPPDPNLDDAT